ncbi:MAG: CocE/NonD family hydrolase, partial [Bryobacteraceae bacterium]
MRDGVRLYANVFLPSEHARVPAILVRTPYGKGEELAPNWRALLEHGFAVMVEDVRGRYESEGEFAPLTQEPADGDDTLNWIARQPWCDGKIGMTGGSYLGIVQWKVALRANPHLKAIFT